MLLLPTATHSEADGQEMPNSVADIGPSASCLIVQLLAASAGVAGRAVGERQASATITASQCLCLLGAEADGFISISDIRHSYPSYVVTDRIYPCQRDLTPH